MSRSWPGRALRGLAAFALTILIAGNSRRCPAEEPARRPEATSLERPLTATWGAVGVGRDPRMFDALADLGVGWVRIAEYRLGEHRHDLARVTRAGFGLWLTLSHRDAGNVVDPRALARTPRGGFPPADAEAFKKRVRAAIEPVARDLRARGKDPSEWLVVQVENEVLPTDVLPQDRPSRFWHGTGEEYLSTLALTHDAVKSVDPSIPVAAAGLSSEMLAELVAGRHARLTAWGEKLLREGRADWMDVHLYHRPSEIAAKVAWVRERWDGPIAGTEVGGPDPDSGAACDDDAQAADLDARLRAARGAGVERVFWSPIHAGGQMEERFRPMGLITKEGRRRPAFARYRTWVASE